MASRAELEEEWRDYQLWQKSQTTDYHDYLEWRDLQIAKENIDTLRNLVESMPDDGVVSVHDLKELLKNV